MQSFKPATQINNFRTKRIIVMGLGRFGGGIGVTRYLATQGADLLVTDMADESKLAASIEKLSDITVRYRLGEHRQEDLDSADLLVTNPGVDKRTSTFFQAAMQRNIPWTSEMNIFLQKCPATTIGITGTAGKSTTTSMIAHILTAAVEAKAIPNRKVWLGGNIGQSLLSELDNMQPDDLCVLELSSFQLEDATGIPHRPRVGLLMNLAPNHLDRHGDMAAYLDAKLNLFRHQQPGDFAIVGPDQPDLLAALQEVASNTGASAIEVKMERQFELFIPGEHNRINANCAACVCEKLGVPGDIIAESLKSFRALPHRLQFVRTVAGVHFYNDSKSTTPAATITSVKSFDSQPIVILGGYDKGLPLEEMGEFLTKRSKAVVVCGAAGDRYGQAVEAARAESATPPVHRCTNMAEAVEKARSIAETGDTVLLSPGCSSFDEFSNYEFRGDAFTDQVNGWQDE